MHRRLFIRKAGITAAGVGIGLSGCKQKKILLPTIAAKDKIRIGIIGTGYRGLDIIKVLMEAPEYDLVACCDVLEFRVEKALAGITVNPKIYTDYRKLLEHKGLDAVVISTPLHLHYQMVMDSLDAGMHIICEKALTYSIEEAIQIKKRARQSKKLFQVSYQYQLNPVFNAIKEIINSGHLGIITRVEGIWNRNNDWRRPLPSADLERQINWRMYREYSGGLMAELGSHQLNMMDNIIGNHPVKVVGTGGIDYWKDGREVCDNVHAIFDYSNDVKASFSSSLANQFGGFEMRFFGDKASIISHGMERAYLYPEKDSDRDWDETIDGVSGASVKLIDKDRKREIKPLVDQKYPFDSNYLNTTWLLYKNFAAAIKGKEELKLGLIEGYQSAISVHMANKAIRQEEVVRWLPEYDA